MGIIVNNKVASPNEFAKLVIRDYTECMYWGERYPDEYNKMTDRERDAVNEMVEKRHDGIMEYLGMSKVVRKLGIL